MSEMNWLFVVVVAGFCALATVVAKGFDRVIDRLDEIEERLGIKQPEEPNE